MSEQIPKSVRGYELGDVIGDGGFGAVYRAYQPVVDREVAIKVILPDFANNPDFILRFEREAHFVARLEHPHIVPIYDYWRDPGGAYLVMRLLRGGSLSSLLNKHGPWPLGAAVRLIDQIAGALAVAHQNNIVHQDLKPGNILFDEIGNAYLVDFGIAREVFNLSPDINARYGSPGFASPEQVLGDFVTPRADIYSFGLVIYAILTGESAFDDTSATTMLRKSITETIPLLMEKRPDLPPELDMMIRRATAKDPNARYPDVFSLAEDFRRIIGMAPLIDMPVVGQKSFVEGGTIELASREALSSTFKLDQVENEKTGILSPSKGNRTPVLPLARTGVLPSSPAPQNERTNILKPAVRNPFKGLRAFDEADAQDFYGRKMLITQLLTPLQDGGRFLAVVGPSGSGKSSVVSAGMLPAIRHGAITGSERWLISRMVPGTHPLKELEQTLLRVAFEAPEVPIETTLRANDTGLQQVIQSILPPNSQLLIFIDQFEETFTLTDTDEERNCFLNNLTAALTAENCPLRVIVALRADFYDRPLLFPGFSELIRKHTEVVVPLTSGDLEQIIIQPAKNAGLVSDTELVTAMVADLREQPGALPLLQFALTELFERRDGQHLTLKAYHEIGGVSGALVRRANDLYQELETDRQSITRQIFLRLIALGEGSNPTDTRRRIALADLLSITTHTENVTAVLNLFGKYRLLTFDRDPDTRAPTVEIAHESLIRQWEQLRDWIENSRADLRQQQYLAAAVNEWDRSGEDTSFLASGVRLTQFESLLTTQNVALSGRERAYIQASIGLRQRAANRLRLFVSVLVVITFAAVGFALYAFDQQQRADQQADISRSRELAMSAITSRNRLDRNLLTSLQALHSYNTLEAQRSLLTGLLANPRLIAFLPVENDALHSVALSPDGKTLAAAGQNHTIFLWDVGSRQPIGQPLKAHIATVRGLIFHPDGTQLVSVGQDGQAILWDWRTGEIIHRYQNSEISPELWAVALSPDGEKLAVSSDKISLWTVSDPENPITLSDHSDIVYALDFSPDGQILASGSADNTIHLWDMTDEDYGSRILNGHENWVQTLQFSPDGRFLASSGPENSVFLWDMESETQLGKFRTNHTNWVRKLAFSPSGLMLATSSLDNTIRVWDLTNAQQIGTPFTGHTDAVWDVRFTPDNNGLISASSDSSVILWTLQPRQLLARRLEGHSQPVWTLAFSPDGAMFASGSGSTGPGGDFNVHLWNRDGTKRAVLTGHRALVSSVIFSPDGHRVISGSADRTVRVWSPDSEEEIQILTGHTGSVTGTAFHPQQEMIVSSDDKGGTMLWIQGEDAWEKHAEWSQDSGITDLALSPDGSLLVTARVDQRMTVWDVETQTLLGELADGHSDLIESLAFSPDGKLLATGSRDSTIMLWDIRTYQPVGQRLKFHTNWVSGLSFSPDGKLLASASRDNTIQLWDVNEGEPLGPSLVGHNNWVNTVQFSPDGNTLVSGAWDNSVIVWDVNLADWKMFACQIANRNLTPEEWSAGGDLALYTPLCPVVD